MTLISVTQQDINGGLRYSTCSCPVALSINRELNTLCVVGGSKCYINTIVHELPPEAVHFIRAYDSDLPVQPFVFVLFPS